MEWLGTHSFDRHIAEKDAIHANVLKRKTNLVSYPNQRCFEEHVDIVYLFQPRMAGKLFF